MNRPWLPIATIVAVMIAARLVLLAADAVPFNSDEAVVGLMARHILQGERPAFFYGQAYLGSTDAWLVAIACAVFGPSVWMIRLVQIALFAATLFTTYPVARRLGLDEWTARAAVMLMALPPTLLTLYTTATLGGYGETLLFGNLLILQFVLPEFVISFFKLFFIPTIYKIPPSNLHRLTSFICIIFKTTFDVTKFIVSLF